MKKIVFMILFMTSMVGFANLKSLPRFDIKISTDSINNISRDIKVVGDSKMIFDFKFNKEDNFKFEVFDKIILDNKIYLVGNGTNNVKVIMLDNGSIFIPITVRKNLVIKDEKIFSYISEKICRL